MYTVQKGRKGIRRARRWVIGEGKRASLVKRAVLIALGGFLVLSGAMSTYSSVLAAANITGVVYNDYNGNGVRDNANGATPNRAIDSGVQGVTVKAFDKAGANCATTTTAADGSYTLPMGPCSGTEFRVEFSTLPATTEPTQFGGQNATTTQFVAEGGTANLGINKIGNFCQNNPTVVTSCVVFGQRPTGPDPTDPGIKGSLYTAANNDPINLDLADISDVGAIHGMAYRKADRTLYAAAYAKRHVDFGPGGPGAIYSSGPIPASGSGSASPSLFATIPNAGVDRHPVSTSNCDGRDGTPGGVAPGGGDCWEWDQFMFDAAGKSGLGDMEVYEDPTNAANDALLVVNLNDRNVYRVTNLGGSPSVGAPIAMPLALPGAAQGCAQADVRPFALHIADGVGYAGLTCTAESTANAANLRAYVYTFDPVAGTFGSSPILEVPLTYQRGCAFGNCPPLIADWNPWIDTFAIPPILERPNPPFTNEIAYPSPLLSDLVIGTDGSMTLAIRDRFGDQMTYVDGRNTTVGDTTSYTGNTAGDLLRACLVGNTWTLENAGTCNGLGPGPAGEHSVEPSRGQGPGGSEFYNFEFYDNGTGNSEYMDETTVGSVASVPGFNEVVSTVMDPLTVGPSAGTHIYDTATGAKTTAHDVPSDVTFTKANPLGDLEIICDLAPVEVGNRIWFDANKNGVQDADETPIAGVTVNLYNASDTLIGSVVTDSNGGYYFSNRSVDENGNPLSDSTGKDYGITALTTNTNGYYVQLDNPADYSDPAKLEGFLLTIADSTQDNGNNQNDSDANLPGAGDPSAANAPFVTFNTGPAGANNHTYDFGFVLASSPAPSPSGGGGTPSATGSGGLASTGQNLIWLIAASAVLIAGGGGAYLYLRRRHSHARSR